MLSTAAIWRKIQAADDILADQLVNNRRRDYLLALVLYTHLEPHYTAITDILQNCPADNLFTEFLTMLQKCAQHHPDLPAIFDAFNFNYQRDFKEADNAAVGLRHLLEIFADPNIGEALGDREVVLALVRQILEAARPYYGRSEITMPPALAQLLVDLLGPQPGMEFFAPFGSNDALLPAAREAGLKVFCQEIELVQWAVTAATTWLHGDNTANIFLGNIFNNPGNAENGSLHHYPLVAGMFPWAFNKWNRVLPDDLANHPEYDIYKRFNLGVPSAALGDWAYIQHGLSCLEPNGRLAVVVPEGLLFRQNDGKIRQNAINNQLIEAVISLPSRLLDFTAISINILVFRNTKNDSIMFIDASGEDFYEKRKTQNILTAEGCKKITNAFKTRGAQQGFCRLVPISEVAANDYNLKVSRYVRPEITDDDCDLSALKEHIEELESELKAVQAQMRKYLERLKY